MEKQFVAFQIGSDRYCINIMDVQKVVREQNLTRMPNFPTFVEGVVNLQGVIVPVLSIYKKINPHLTVATTEYKSPFKLLIVKISDILIGLQVDALDQILELDEQEIQDSDLKVLTTTNIISGMIAKDEKIYYVINTSGILESDEHRILNNVLNI